MADIRPMVAADLAEARRIAGLAFATFLGVPDPETFWNDRDLISSRFGAPHIEAFAAEEDGALIGSNFATRWGSLGFFGPVSIRPDRWNSGLGRRLVAAACDCFEGWGLSHAGLFTFPHSTKHVWLYQQYGFYPRFLTPIMAAPAAVDTALPPGARYSELDESERGLALADARNVAEQLYGGLDLGGEIRHVTARGLGDTVLLRDGSGRVDGFSICHWGPSSEAGAGCCYVKFGAVAPGDKAPRRFAALLDLCAGLAGAVGMERVLAGVNLAREEAYRAMLAQGFRTQFQGIAMHRGNEPGYSRPGLFVLDDWR